MAPEFRLLGPCDLDLFQMLGLPTIFQKPKVVYKLQLHSSKDFIRLYITQECFWVDRVSKGFSGIL